MHEYKERSVYQKSISLDPRSSYITTIDGRTRQEEERKKKEE